jgi:hypothetical protein
MLAERAWAAEWDQLETDNVKPIMAKRLDGSVTRRRIF